MITTVVSPWVSTFDSLVSQATTSLVLCSPYIGREPCERITSSLVRANRTEIDILVLTDLSRDNMLSGATDVSALIGLCEALPRTDIRFLPTVHAKVYVADQAFAVVTSGNLTQSGLRRNLEYGIAVSDVPLVKQIRSEILEYREVGSELSLPQLRVFKGIVDELQEYRNNLTKSVKKQLALEFNAKLQDAKETILRARVDGLSSHAVFADTILFILKNGPLTTKEMYPQIQAIHPDLCDDTIKLVISGEEWSQAKWRHRVRHAQLALARQGRITRQDGSWHVIK